MKWVLECGSSKAYPISMPALTISKLFLYININDILPWKLIKWLNRISNHAEQETNLSKWNPILWLSRKSNWHFMLLYLIKMKSMGQQIINNDKTKQKKNSYKTCFGMTMDWHHQIVENPVLISVAFVFWLGKTENNDIYFKFEINSAYSFVLIRPTLLFYGSNWTIPIVNFSEKMLSDIQKQTPKWWCKFDIGPDLRTNSPNKAPKYAP